MEIKKSKFWSMRPRNEAAGTPAEIILYGEISDSTWWGDEVTPRQFNEDFSAIAGNAPEIVVRINSGGGDVFAAHAIYTRLKDSGKRIVVKIDGWAASAATIIAMAGDEIHIAASGVFMIHNPMFMLKGAYNAAEMKKLTAALETTKSCIINAYRLQTGKSAEELAQMMSDERWFSGEEAVENGFCTALMFEQVKTAALAENHVIVNRVDINLSRFKNTPNGLFPLREKAEAENKIKKTEKEKSMEIKNVKELRAAYPELAEELTEQARAEERTRIMEIENISTPGFEEIIKAAKYGKPDSAANVAIAIIKAQKQAGSKYLGERDKDAEDSNAKNAAVHNQTPPREKEANEALDILNKRYPVKN